MQRTITEYGEKNQRLLVSCYLWVASLCNIAALICGGKKTANRKHVLHGKLAPVSMQPSASRCSCIAEIETEDLFAPRENGFKCTLNLVRLFY